MNRKVATGVSPRKEISIRSAQTGGTRLGRCGKSSMRSVPAGDEAGVTLRRTRIDVDFRFLAICLILALHAEFIARRMSKESNLGTLLWLVDSLLEFNFYLQRIDNFAQSTRSEILFSVNQ